MFWGYVDDFTQIVGVTVALGAALLWLGLEAIRHYRSLARVPVRVHVAGTRGKTTVTRLTGAGLRGGGLRVLVKTTGTDPLLIFPDGTEQPWRRRGLPTIGEQMRFMRLAARLGVDAVVIESMAIQPEYLWASERYLVRATDAVITNLRPDHEEELGTDPADMAAALALITPTGGRLVVAQEAAAPAILKRSRDLGTSVNIVSDEGIDAVNWAMALEVCANLGVDHASAARSMGSAGADSGQFFVTETDTAAGRIRFAYAFAVNDTASFEQLWREQNPPEGAVILFNGRADRPLRTRAFLELFAGLKPAVQLFTAGAVPRAAIRAAGLPPAGITRLRARGATAALEELARAAGDGGMVWGVGNYAGIGKCLAERLRQDGASC